MSRSILLCTALAAVALACNNKAAANAQMEANKAQEKANSAIASANGEANAKALAAQAEANNKIDAVLQSDFAKMREDYRRQMRADLDSLNKSITDLEAKQMTATGKTKTELDGVLPLLKTRRDGFTNDLPTIDGANGTTWDATRVRLDKEWADLKVMADGATS
jgi:BMFP domain-containing protein YqiC